MACEDKCKEIGKAWRKLDDARKLALGAANKRRKELVLESERLRKEVEDRIETLGTEIESQHLKVKGLEKELVEAEQKERLKVVKGGKGKRVNVLAGLAKERIEELRTALVEVNTERKEKAQTVKELEGMLSKFKDEYNPNFNDEGVKRAVKSWEDYAAKQPAPDAEADTVDADLEEIMKQDGGDNGIRWEEWEGAPDADSDVDASTCTHYVDSPPGSNDLHSLPILRLPPQVRPRMDRPSTLCLP